VLKCLVARPATTMLKLGSAGYGCFPEIARVIGALIALLNAARLYRLPVSRLSMVLLLASSAAAQGQSSAWDKRPEYRQAGYTELTGADAARFLVGNSVIVPEEKDGTMIASQKQIYYFLDDHAMYQCGTAGGTQCFIGSWSVAGDEICLDVGGCIKPFVVLRSPRWEDWERQAGRLGIYLTNNHVAYEVVKGNWTAGPLFDSRMSGHPIELNRVDFAKEVAAADRFNLPNGQIRVYGSRALSLLIGNTFLSKDAEAAMKSDPENFCPKEGEYYSPDGTVIHFTCDGSPKHSWWTGITHWKVVSGLWCGTYFDHVEDFECKQAVVTAVPAPQSADGKIRILDYGGSGLIDNSRTAYSGNVFKFRFDGRNK